MYLDNYNCCCGVIRVITRKLGNYYEFIRAVYNGIIMRLLITRRLKKPNSELQDLHLVTLSSIKDQTSDTEGPRRHLMKIVF